MAKLYDFEYLLNDAGGFGVGKSGTSTLDVIKKRYRILMILLNDEIIALVLEDLLDVGNAWMSQLLQHGQFDLKELSLESIESALSDNLGHKSFSYIHWMAIFVRDGHHIRAKPHLAKCIVA